MEITREMKMQMFGMYLDGMCLDEIAEEMKINESKVYDTLNVYQIDKNKRSGYAYPHIMRWIMRNECTQSELAKRCGIHVVQLNSYMTGRRTPSKDSIDKILRATGMTYEEAFGDPRKEHD